MNHARQERGLIPTGPASASNKHFMQLARVFQSKPPLQSHAKSAPNASAIAMLSLAKRATSSSLLSSPQYQNLALLIPLLRSSFSTQPQHPKELPFIAQYLISSFGFSSDRARKVSARTHLAAIDSPARPQAVVKFLSDTGLTDAQIKAAVSISPIILGYNVDKTLKPNALELLEKGFSQELLVQLIRYCPGALEMKITLSRLLFWKDFVGDDDEALILFIQKAASVFLRDTDNYIVPRINILKEYGLSNPDITDLLVNGSRFLCHNLDSLRQTVDLIEELGITRGSSKFLWGLKAVSSFTKDEILKRAELYQTTYNWSKEDLRSAFWTYPYILEYSEKKIKSNMKFLIENAKLEPRSIASTPVLLGYSVAKRLIPRHHVLTILAAKGLKKNYRFSTACAYTEKRFLAMFVEPYKKDVPELAEAYFSASHGNVFVC